MKKILASDNALRIISVLIAIVIWIYIAIVMNPTIEVAVRDLPIQFVGGETLAARGLAVISESATTVNIKVQGNRKKMGNNDMKTIIVKADESVITEPGTHSVPIEVVVPFESQGISSQSKYTVDVKVEELVTQKHKIDVVTGGSLAQNYVAGNAVPESEFVEIKGPKSAVEKIGKAVVNLTFNAQDVDIDTELPIEYLGADMKELSSMDVIFTRITTSIDKVKVHCPVLKTQKTDVKANFGYQSLPEGFSYKTEPSSVYVYSDVRDVSKITEVTTEEISYDKLTSAGKVKVKLNIPEDVRVVGDVAEVEISLENK